MVARPSWEGHLRLSLVKCPVALYPATTEAETIRFNLINPKTNNRIKMKTVDAGTEKEVARGDLVGTDFSDYFTEPDLARQGYLRVFAQGFVTDYPLTIRHVGGELTEVLYNASVYRDAAGRVLGVFAAARDVTAQKQAESEVAEQRGRELDRLAELERFQKLTVGRELRMIELKKEIKALRAAAGGE